MVIKKGKIKPGAPFHFTPGGPSFDGHEIREYGMVLDICNSRDLRRLPEGCRLRIFLGGTLIQSSLGPHSMDTVSEERDNVQLRLARHGFQTGQRLFLQQFASSVLSDALWSS
jgi:hypothetical protein